MFEMRMTKLSWNLPKEEIFFPTTKYPNGFSGHLLHLFFTISFPNDSQYLASYFCRYQSLSPSPLHQNFDSCFLVFRKCGVTPHRLYRDSLTLFKNPFILIFFFFWKSRSISILRIKISDQWSVLWDQLN